MLQTGSQNRILFLQFLQCLLPGAGKQINPGRSGVLLRSGLRSLRRRLEGLRSGSGFSGDAAGLGDAEAVQVQKTEANVPPSPDSARWGMMNRKPGKFLQEVFDPDRLSCLAALMDEISVQCVLQKNFMRCSVAQKTSVIYRIVPAP